MSRKDQSSEVEMDMTPMIDIVFLLIIFFMIVSEIANLDIEQVVLPEEPQARVEEPTPGVPTIKVNVVVAEDATRKGAIKIGGQDYTKLDALVAFLKLEVSSRPDLMKANELNPNQKDSMIEVLIRADEHVNMKYVHRVTKACQQAKIHKVNWAALSERAGDPYVE